MILMTNDDGIYAPGLWALYEELSQLGEVAVVAPDSEQSAVGHAITLINPLRVKKVTIDGGVQGWAVSGTPADCVKIAMAELLPQTPEMVVSGINLGPTWASTSCTPAPCPPPPRPASWGSGHGLFPQFL